MKIWTLFLSIVCLNLSIHALGAEPQFPKNIESEIENLNRNRIQFQADSQGVDLRKKDLPSLTLAWLYLSALKEQYEVTQLQVAGMVQVNREYYPLHDAHHLFDERVESAMSYKEWYTALGYLIPDMQHEVKIEIQKARTFEQIQNLRMRILAVLTERNRGDLTESNAAEQISALSQQIEKVIERFPGNSQAHREEYLRELGQSEIFDQRIGELKEEVRFQSRISLAATQEKVRSYERAVLFFTMLNSYFQDIESSPYILWPKIIPLADRGGNFSGLLKLRFFISDAVSFRRALFGYEFPVQLAANWFGLIQGKASPEVLSWAWSSTQQFISRYQRHFKGKSAARLEQVRRLIETSGPPNFRTKIIPLQWDNILSARRLIYETDEGHQFNTRNIFRTVGLQGTASTLKPLGVNRVLIEDNDLDGTPLRAEFLKEQFFEMNGAYGFKETVRVGGATATQVRQFPKPSDPARACYRKTSGVSLSQQAEKAGRRASELLKSKKPEDIEKAYSLLLNPLQSDENVQEQVDPDCLNRIKDRLFYQIQFPAFNLNQRIFMNVAGGVPTIQSLILNTSSQGREFYQRVIQDWARDERELYQDGLLIRAQAIQD